MEEKNILTLSKDGVTTQYLIERVIRLDEQLFFTVINLNDGNLMFGEYTDELPLDDEKAIEIICEDFRKGCEHVIYPDGYIQDDLYEMIDWM